MAFWIKVLVSVCCKEHCYQIIKGINPTTVETCTPSVYEVSLANVNTSIVNLAIRKSDTTRKALNRAHTSVMP